MSSPNLRQECSISHKLPISAHGKHKSLSNLRQQRSACNETGLWAQVRFR